MLFLLAWDKRVTGRQLANAVLPTDARVTVIDGILAASGPVVLVLNMLFGWWLADPLAGVIGVHYPFVYHPFKERLHPWCGDT